MSSSSLGWNCIVQNYQQWDSCEGTKASTQPFFWDNEALQWAGIPLIAWSWLLLLDFSWWVMASKTFVVWVLLEDSQCKGHSMTDMIVVNQRKSHIVCGQFTVSVDFSGFWPVLHVARGRRRLMDRTVVSMYVQLFPHNFVYQTPTHPWYCRKQRKMSQMSVRSCARARIKKSYDHPPTTVNMMRPAVFPLSSPSTFDRSPSSAVTDRRTTSAVSLKQRICNVN